MRHGSATRSAATLCDQRPLARGRNDRHCQRCCVKRMYGRKLPHLLGRPRTTGNLRIRKCTTKTAANGTMALSSRAGALSSWEVWSTSGRVNRGESCALRRISVVWEHWRLLWGWAPRWLPDMGLPGRTTRLIRQDRRLMNRRRRASWIHRTRKPARTSRPPDIEGRRGQRWGRRIQAVGAVDGTIRDHDDRRQRTTVDPSRLPARPTGQALRPTGEGCCGWTWSDSRG